jgi:hypothetical protein
LDGIRTAESKQRAFFITAAGAMHRTVLEAMVGNCHYLDRPQLSALCDNHKLFWAGFQDSILSSRVALAPEKPKNLRPHQRGAIAPVPRNSANSDEFSRKEWLEFLPVTLAY